MTDRVPGILTHIEHEAEAGFGDRVLFCDPLGQEEHVSERRTISGIDGSSVINVAFRDHKDVGRCCWVEIAKRQGQVGFVNDRGRNGSVDDVTEEAIRTSIHSSNGTR